MAELFASLDEFKAHVGGGINQTVDLRSLAPVIADTARRHLTPYLSQDFYDTMVQEAASLTPDADAVALLPYIRRPLALLSMYEYAKIAGVEFGESGMFRIETENRKSAYRYQEKDYSMYMREKGYDALEILLKYLDDNISTYSDWGTSDEAEAHLAPLLTYAGDFRRLSNVGCDRYTFETMRPIIVQVQELGVEKLLPSAFWQDFHAGYLINDLSTAESTLLDMMRVAIAHRAIEEATRISMVHVREGRVYVIEEFGAQNNLNKTMPTGGLPGIHMIANQLWGDRHTTRWKQFILDNPDEFPLVFDEDSGGDNTDDDAWHINTDDEQDIADNEAIETKKKPIFRM